MKSRFLLLALLLTTVIVCPASAQVTSVQTVQLPTFHYVGVSTTVVVPTRGTVSLGSIAGSTRTRFDHVGNRSCGVDSFSGGLTVGATVIDLAEMDREILAEAARRRGAKFDVLGRPVELDPIAANSVESERAATYLRRGRTAEMAKQPAAARVFYRWVAKHGSTEERQLARVKLSQLDSAQAEVPNAKVR